MKPSEYRDLTDEELDQRCRDARKEMFNLRIQQTTGQLENPLRLRHIRRDVARLVTEQNDRRRKAQ